MMTWLSWGDIGDLQRKFRFKGRNILSRLLQSSQKKVASNWDQTQLPPSNWWNIPAVRERWEKMITDGKYPHYSELIQKEFLAGKTGLSMASPGCGTGSHEQYFASFEEIEKIDAFDISEASIELARKSEIKKIDYQVRDFYQWMDDGNQYDIIFFYSSLHHFGNLEQLIPRFKQKLHPKGLLIIHEYAGPDRMMWTKEQLAEVQRLLAQLPEDRRKYVMGSGIKQRAFRPGLWRTLLSDPSESIEPSKIRPLLRKHYSPLYERGFGGNILHLLFKDIAQHFLDNDTETHHLLNQLFEAEDAFLKTHEDDYFFGIYSA